MRNFINFCLLLSSVFISTIVCSKDNPVIYGSTNLYKVGVYVAAKDSTASDEIFYNFRKLLLPCLVNKIDDIPCATNKQFLEWSINHKVDYVAVLTTCVVSDTSTLVIWLRERTGFDWKDKFCTAIPVSNGNFIASLDTAAKLMNTFMSCSLAIGTTDTARAIEISPELIRIAPLDYSGPDTGCVYLQGKVTFNGLVDEVVIAKSSGSISLDSAALNCFYGYLFTPAIAVDKRPVEVWVMVPVRYP